MPETITAIYENGVFRPLSAVSFQDGETVQIPVGQCRTTVGYAFLIQK